MVAQYASMPDKSRGRLYPEGESAHRTPFQRDRDRIIHSSAFRRLKHKTQVFVEHEGDYFRTRLTHSLEVAQVARTIARVLEVDQDLAEAISLAHDLGHTPFGHTGEDALDECMTPYGGFDHNTQAIRIVTSLERHYADWDGLNLTWETLEGLAKHNGPVRAPVPQPLADYTARHDLELDTYASLEAQISALSDDIAYNHHDLHDGLRAGLFTQDEIATLPRVAECYREVDKRYPDIEPDRRQHEALRRFFGLLVEDVIAEAKSNLATLNPTCAGDIRAAGAPMARFSTGFWADLKEIRQFLFERMYRAPGVVKMRECVSEVTQELFDIFMDRPDLLPDTWQSDLKNTDKNDGQARIVADYIAGMTDRFALKTHALMTGRSGLVWEGYSYGN